MDIKKLRCGAKFAGRIASALLVVALSSCGSAKTDMTYFSDLQQLEGQLPTAAYNLTIVPDDQLQISVTSLSPASTMIYNLSNTYSATLDPNTGIINYSPTSAQHVYLVSPAGDITFPVLGKLHVEGLTTEQVADMIAQRISADVENPIVTVDLVSFHVNVLGEVNRPGTVPSVGERFSILDAIARAGDLSQYAVRDNVLVIREGADGKKEYHRINLNDSRVFESPYYYLKQNDIIVVDPNDVRKDNARYNVNNAYKIQVTSAIISASSVIASLVIALAVK